MNIELNSDKVRNLIAKARGNQGATTQEAEAFLLLHGENLVAAINKMIVEYVNNVINYDGN